MKSIKFLASTAVIIGSLAFSAPGFAGGDRDFGPGFKHHQDWRPDHGGKRFDNFLELTDAQKETLRAQHEAERPSQHALHSKIAEGHEALNTAVESGANDAELSALAETLGKLHAEQALAGAQAYKAFVAVLTPEQKQKLAEAKAKREERKKSRDARQQNASSASR